MSTECLLQREGSAPCDAAADRYVDLVGSGAERTRTEVIGILALGAVYAEVRSAVRFQQVRALINRPHDPARGAKDRDCRRWQLASRSAIGREFERDRYNTAPGVEDARSICINWLL